MAHDFQRSRFTGATTCAKCGLLPMDEDDLLTTCEPPALAGFDRAQADAMTLQLAHGRRHIGSVSGPLFDNQGAFDWKTMAQPFPYTKGGR